MAPVTPSTHTLPNTQVEQRLEQHRRELTGYCYRMLGSSFEAEDAVQETMVRAWKGVERLEAREALRSWLYRIATNVCLDMLQSAKRRAQPMDLAEPQTADALLGAPLPETTWIQPMPDARVLPDTGDPAELAASRETLRLAFVAALQHLPPKQRAVLILREVLRWQASEVAELLDTTTVSVNSALQRARATIDQIAPQEDGPAQVDEAEQQELLARYVELFERYDIEELVKLLAHDANFTMPPFDLWLRGPEQAKRWMLGPGIACKDAKVFTRWANGCPAMASYKPDEDGVFRPWAVAVLEVEDGRITSVLNFLGDRLFPVFDLPESLPPDAS
ncbi:MAG: sigma-70 family RNA polymerase sigma factor [Solirubrobacterales bacterium]|nr:sigma-70 family RNA polymerase sigma factor [Solirubrobacterales bacterium]